MKDMKHTNGDRISRLKEDHIRIVENMFAN